MKIDFRVSADAADFIRKNKLRADDGRAMVIQLYAVLQKPNDSTVRMETLEQAIEHAEREIQSLPSSGIFRWVVGSNYRDSIPPEDVHVVEGIPFDLPEDINRMIGDRELIVESSELRFEPDLEPLLRGRES